MATYYKYAERSADSTINWAEVGQDMTNMLKEEARLREAKKAAIDKETRELGETLSNAPMGDFVPAKEFALEFAGSAQETRLIQDKLLRSGMLKPKDYAIMRQNLNDGTNTMFDLAKKYQEEAARKMERSTATDPAQRNQELEMWFMEQAEGLGNLSDAKAVINQTNGQVSLGKMITGEDGVRRLDPNYNYTVNELNARIKQDFNYFDLDTAMLQEEAMLGEVKSMVIDAAKKSNDLNTIYTFIDKKNGNYLTDSEKASLQAAVDNATTPEEKALAERRQQEALAANSYLAAENNIIEKYMVNQFNVSSMLTENVRNDFDYTFVNTEEDALDKNGNRREDVIIVKRKPSGELDLDFTEEQEEDVRKLLRLNLRSKISTSEEAKSAGFKPETSFERAYGTTKGSEAVDKEKGLGVVTLWNQIFTAEDAIARQAAVDAIVENPIAQQNGIVDIDFSGIGENQNITIYKMNEDNEVIPITKAYNPSEMNLLLHAELGNLVHGISGVSDLKRQIGKDGFSTNRKLKGDPNFESIKTEKRLIQTSKQARLQAFDKELIEAGDDYDKLEALAEQAGLRFSVDSDDNKTVVDANGKVLVNAGYTLGADELAKAIAAGKNSKEAIDNINRNRTETGSKGNDREDNNGEASGDVILQGNTGG